MRDKNHAEPAPRRIRGYVGGQAVFDTVNAMYVWETPYYPQYYIPLGDVRPEVLVDEGSQGGTSRGQVKSYGLQVGDQERPKAAKLYEHSTIDGLTGTVRFDWQALDSWFEEDEEILGHPRDPYVRVDSLRSSRRVRVELDGVVLADTASPVLVFETGLTTRYYISRTDVDFTKLEGSDTSTYCPYKGRTSGYWSARIGDRLYDDVAWAYDFPTRQLLPIAGLIAFYSEKVDVQVSPGR